MGQDAEELRREIAGTRADMSGTLDAIGDRVSPGRMVQRRKNRFVESVHGVRDRVMGTASDAKARASDTSGSTVDAVKGAPDDILQRTQGAPMVAGAVAFGAGFLIAATLPGSQVEKEVSAKLLDQVEPVKQELTAAAHDIADNLKEPAKEAAQQVKDTAAGGAQHVGETAKGAVDDTKRQAADSADSVRSAAPGT